MNNDQFEEMLMRRGYRSTRRSKYYDSTITLIQLHPKSLLITNIYKYNAEELIRQIIKINDNKACQLIQKQLQTKKAWSIESSFNKLLGKKIYECLDYIGNQNLYNEIVTIKFLQSLQFIIKDLNIKIDSDFLLKIINIIKNSENFLVVNQCFCILALRDVFHQFKDSSKKSKEIQVKKQFEQICTQLENIIKKQLKNESEQPKIMKILCILDKLSIQEKLVLELHCEWVTELINKKFSIQSKIQLQNKITKYLKQNESKLLFSVINKCKVQYNALFAKISSQFSSFKMNLQTLQLESKTKIIYPNMVKPQNIIYFITHSELNLKQLLQNCIIIEGDKIYVSLDFTILQNIQTAIQQREVNFQMQNVFNLKQILLKLIDNLNLKLHFVCGGIMKQINIIEYICNLFQILVRYQNMGASTIKLKLDLEQMYNEKFVQILLKQLQKWSKQQQTAKFLKNIYGQIISYATFYIHAKKQRNQLANILGKKAIQFIQYYKNIPPKWRIIKHAKYIIEFWSSQLQPTQQQIKRVTQIWFEGYFNQNFEFTKGSYQFLKSQKTNEKYLDFFSECLLKQIQKFTQQKLCKLNIEQQNNEIILNKFCYQIKIILKSKIKLTKAHQIGEILYSQYQKNAHKLKYLKDLKTWIFQNYKSTVTQQILNRQKQIQLQISEIKLNNQVLENYQQFFSCQPNKTFKNIEKINKFIEIIPNLQLLINQLQLKSQKQIFTEQMYTILILQIIKPLSKICYHINQQIYLNMTQSKEKVQQFEEIINKSILNPTQAPYKIIIQKTNSLQKIIYDYLCNISLKITLDEAQNIGKVIGTLLNQYINQKVKNQKNSLSILKTINNIFQTQSNRNYYDEYEEEQEQQYVGQFQMGRNLYRISPNIPLSIIIPLFSQQRQHFGQFVQSLIVSKNKVTTKEKYAWSCQKLLAGNGFKELKQNLEESKEYLLTQQSKISSNILSYFVLPSLKVNKDSLHKIGLSLYLEHIRLIFNNQYCQDHFQQFIQKIQTIFKYKNSKRNRYSFDRKFQIVENQQNFTKYEIQPIQLSFFKIQVKKILKNFIDKYPQQIFSNKSSKALQQLHYVISFMKNLEQQNQTEQVDSSYLLVKLIQKGQEFFKNYCVKLQQQNNNPNNDNNQKSSQESQKNSQPSQDNDDSQDQQMIRKKFQKIQKKKNKKKDFGLTVFLNILAKVERNNEKIVKKCFEIGLQIQLLQSLKFSKQIQISDASQILSFISQTLPPIYIQIKKQELLVIQNYYKLILNTFKNLKYKKMGILVSLMKNLIKSAKQFLKVELTQFKNQILNTIQNIVMKSLDCDVFQMSRKSQCEIISQICMTDQSYIEKTLQFRIKHYIIKQYEKHLLKENTQQNQNQNTLMYQIKPNFIQINVQKFRKAFEPELQKYPQIFYKLLKMLFDGYNEKNNTIIYSKGLGTLCKFQSINKSFVECPISQRINQLIVKLVQNFTRVRILGSQLVNERMVQLNQAKSLQQKTQIQKKFFKKIDTITQSVHSYLEILNQFLQQHPLLVPIILTTIVKNKFEKDVMFLDFLVEISIEEKIDSIISFLILFLSKNGLIVNYQQNKYYAEYVSAKIICKVIQKIPKNYQNKELLNNSVYLACFCLMYKQFNNLANLKISNNNETSLFMQIQNLIINHTQIMKQKQSETPMQLLYIQCLYLIHKNCEINKIKQKNQLLDYQVYSQIINEKQFGLYDASNNQFARQKKLRQISLNDQQQDDQINENLFIKIQNKELKSIKNYFKWSSLQQLIIQFENKQNKSKEFMKIVSEDETQIIQIPNTLSLDIIAKNYNISELQKEKNSRTKKQLSRRRRGLQDQFQISNKYLPKPTSLQKHKKIHLYLIRLKKFLSSSKYHVKKDEVKYLKSSRQSRISDRYERWNGQSMRDTLHQIQEQNNIQNFDPTNISRSDVEILIYKQFSLFLKDMNKKQHENKMIQVKTQVRNFTEEQLKLRQNQNYKKLDNMNYVQRFQFLTNQANDGYFLTLPSEISTQIKQQAQLLRNEKQRLKRQKFISSYDNQDMYQSQWSRPRRMRLNNRKITNKVKIIPLQQTEQIIISTKCIQQIIKSIFDRVNNNNQVRRLTQDTQENANRGLRILLNLKNQKIKQKVLTTLLIIIKNIKIMKFRKYLQNQNKQWKMTENIKQTELQLIQKSVLKQILRTLQATLKQQLTNNYQDLFSRNLSINEYYNIFEGEINNKCFSQQLGAHDQQYSPLNQFLDLALDHNQRLASILMKNCKEIKNPIIIKIFDLMKNNKIKSQSFYKNLSVISQNKLISQLFQTNYTVNHPPSIQFLGKILKYKFGELKFAKQLHIKALREYKPTHDLYLKQILRFYSDHQLNGKQHEISPYKQIYRTMLQKYYRFKYKEQDDSLIKLIKMPWILDYKTKLAYFRNQVRSGQQYYSSRYIQLILDQNDILKSAYNQIMRLKKQQITKSNLYFKYSKSTSHGSGMIKVLNSLLKTQLIKPETGLFKVIKDKQVALPNKAMLKNDPNYFNYFRFIGRIMAINVINDKNFPIPLPKVFFKMFLNNMLTWEDLEQVNEDMFYKARGLIMSRKQQPDTNVKQLQLTFSYITKDQNNNNIEVQLKKDGKNILVTNDNYEEFISLEYVQQYLQMKQGFYELIPIQKFHIFTAEDIEKLICGIPIIDRKQFKQNCKLNGFTNQDQQIKWFWKYIDECSDEQLVDVVQHFYGVSRLPEGGFKSVRAQILKLANKDSCPLAGLCGGMTIKLSNYSSEEVMIQKIRQAIKNSKCGQGLMEG